MKHVLHFGSQTWTVSVPEAKTVPFDRPVSSVSPDSPRAQVAAALDAPFGFDSPMRRAVTPDDRVTIVLDETLPAVAEILTAILEHLGTAGIPPSAVTVLVPPGSLTNAWIDDLPDELADITLEVHDPEAAPKIAYLATTKGGRRVYLNRTLVEAEFVIIVTGRRYDPSTAYAGGEAAVFPTMSNGETLAEVVGRFSLDPPNDGPNPRRTEAAEIVWLLGTPFFVQVLEGPGDTVAEVLAGLADCLEEAEIRQDERWRYRIDEYPDLVIAAVSDGADRAMFTTFAAALANAARVVSSTGRIVLLTDGTPRLDEGAEILLELDDLSRAGKTLSKRKPDDWAAAAQWAWAVEQAHVFLAASWDDDTIENFFTTPIRSVAEVQRLIDSAGRVLLLPDAQKLMTERSPSA